MTVFFRGRRRRRGFPDPFHSKSCSQGNVCWAEARRMLGRSPPKNCKNDLDDQTWRELE